MCLFSFSVNKSEEVREVKTKKTSTLVEEGEDSPPSYSQVILSSAASIPSQERFSPLGTLLR